MPIDNYSNIDVLFCQPFVDIIKSIVLNKGSESLTVGIFGLKISFKSMFLKLLKKDMPATSDKVVYIEVNAWMFEDYENAKIALMEPIIKELSAEEHKHIFEPVAAQINNLAKCVDSFKTAKPPVIVNIMNEKNGFAEASSLAASALEQIKSDAKDETVNCHMEDIRKFKKYFEAVLEESGVDNVVILLDDLDRCQPKRIVETMEAIELFLSVRHTTFLILADRQVIDSAVKTKYSQKGSSRKFPPNGYLEKSIDLPIYIPTLSAKDIENYLLLLVAQVSLKKASFRKLLAQVAQKKLLLRESAITFKELCELTSAFHEPYATSEEDFNKDILIFAEIRAMLANKFKGSPRQAKRFANLFFVKKNIAKMLYDDKLDTQVLAKLLVLNEIKPNLFKELNKWHKKGSLENNEFQKMFEHVANGRLLRSNGSEEWRTPEMLKWLECTPREIGKLDLSKYFYILREYLETNLNSSGQEDNDDAKRLLKASGNSLY
ncbi:MAG: P-loop NTPase fold protein [Acidaminococcaceae bacterium]